MKNSEKIAITTIIIGVISGLGAYLILPSSVHGSIPAIFGVAAGFGAGEGVKKLIQDSRLDSESQR